MLARIIGFSLISAAWQSAEGLLGKIVMLLGIIAIFKGLFLLKAKASDKVVEWFAKQPLHYFRLGGLLYATIGVIILFTLT